MVDVTSKNARRRSRTWRTVFVVVAAVIWLVVPLGAAGYLLVKSSQVELPTAHQVWESVQAAPSSLEEQIGVSLSWAEPADIIAPAWSGVVQTIGFKPGQQLVSGATVAKIGGIERIAFTSPEPFIRALSVDDKGADVVQLNQLLASRGFDHGPDDYFNWETRIGVMQLAKSLGAGKNITAFDPAWVVYLASPVSIEKIDLVVGAPAPSEGTAIATGFPTLSSANLTTFAAAKSLLADDKSTAVPPSLDVSADSKVLLGDQELVLTEDRSAIAADSLPAVEAMVGRGSRATVVKTVSPGIEGWSVPSVSVYIDSKGASCVLVKTKGIIRARQVALVSTQDQTAIVTGQLAAGDEIGMDPSLDPRPCS